MCAVPKMAVICISLMSCFVNIALKLDNGGWYDHLPKLVEKNQGCKVNILWNQQVQTDRTIHNNKPKIIIRDKVKGTCILIDVAF